MHQTDLESRSKASPAALDARPSPPERSGAAASRDASATALERARIRAVWGQAAKTATDEIESLERRFGLPAADAAVARQLCHAIADALRARGQDPSDRRWSEIVMFADGLDVRLIDVHRLSSRVGWSAEHSYARVAHRVESLILEAFEVEARAALERGEG